MEVIGVVGHSQHLGDNCVLSPLGSKLLHQLHEVAGGGLADGVHWSDHSETKVCMRSSNKRETPNNTGSKRP